MAQPGTGPAARICVLGDVGVGKSTFVACVADDIEHRPGAAGSAPPEPTVGAVPHVVLHAWQGGDEAVELLDIGGRVIHGDARKLYFEEGGVDGLVLVHDLSNRHSLSNLRRWLAEVTTAMRSGRDEPGATHAYAFHNADGEISSVANQFPLQPPLELEVEARDGRKVRIPILLLGTKADLVSPSATLGPHAVHENLRRPGAFAPESAERAQFDKFLNTCLERRGEQQGGSAAVSAFSAAGSVGVNIGSVNRRLAPPASTGGATRKLD